MTATSAIWPPNIPVSEIFRDPSKMLVNRSCVYPLALPKRQPIRRKLRP